MGAQMSTAQAVQLAVSASAESGVENVSTYSAVVPIYIAFSVTSIVLTAAINWIYWASKRLQGDHASTLISIITVADAAYTMKFFVGAIAWAAGLRDERSSFHLVPDNCRFSAAYGQFTGMACIGWNAVWMYDLVTALRNPLVNTASLRRWYHVAVWTLAAVTTIAVLATPIHETADDHTCRPPANSPAGLLFVLPLFAAMALGLVSLTYAVMRLSGGRRNAEISTIRRSLRNRHALYVAAFILLWAWPILHDYVDPTDQVVSLTVMDAVAVSGQAAVFAAIRLSEPGAAAMFAALCRRVYRALCVYPCARCTRGRDAADSEAARERILLVNALERSASEIDGGKGKQQGQGQGGAQGSWRAGSRGGADSSMTRPASGGLPGWLGGLTRAVRANSRDHLLVDPTKRIGAGVGGGAVGQGKETSADADRRARAAAMLSSAKRKPSVEDWGTTDARPGARGGQQGDDGDVEAGRVQDGHYQDVDLGADGEGDGQGEDEAGASLSQYRAALTAGELVTPASKTTASARGGSFFGFFTRGASSSGGNGGGNNSGSSSSGGGGGSSSAGGRLGEGSYQGGAGLGGDYYDDDEGRGDSLLANQYEGAEVGSARGSVSGRASMGRPGSSGNMTGSSSGGVGGSGGLPRPGSMSSSSRDGEKSGRTGGGYGSSSAAPKGGIADGIGRETSFAVAEAQALGSGWDVASAAGLRLELGATMLAALIEAVQVGDARARGGKEASVYGFRSPRVRNRTRTASSTGSPRPRQGSGGFVDSQGSGGGVGVGGQSGSDAPVDKQRHDEEEEEHDEDEERDKFDAGRVMSNPLAPESRRSVQSWLRDPTTSHLSVCVQHTVSGEGGAPKPQTASQDDEDDDMVDVQVASFADADFAYIRRAASVVPGEVAKGFDPALLRSGELRAHFSDGASSSFFCRSLDNALVLKTLNAAEVEMLLRLLPAYARHLADNPDSLLTRFYGCFCVTLAPTAAWGAGLLGGRGARGGRGAAGAGAGSRVYFTLMSNVFPVSVSLSDPTASADMTVFDLKGSTINRRARPVKEDLPLGGGGGGAGAGKGAGSSSGGSGNGAGEAGEGGAGAEGKSSLPGKPSLLLDLDLRESYPRGLPLADPKTFLGKPEEAMPSGADVAAGRSRAAAVLDQLRRDVTLLASQGLMDYSLLLQLIPIDSGVRGEGGGEGRRGAGQAHEGSNAGSRMDAGTLLRVRADTALSLDQVQQLLSAAANPPRRPAPAPLSIPQPGSGGVGVYGDLSIPQGPQLLLPVLTASTSGAAAAPQGLTISRWSTLAVSLCAVGSGGEGADQGKGKGGAGAAAAQGAGAAYPSRALLQLGVVDVLQFFDTTKRLENALKNLRYGSLTGEADVSAVDPHRYAVRFTDFLERVLQP